MAYLLRHLDHVWNAEKLKWIDFDDGLFFGGERFWMINDCDGRNWVNPKTKLFWYHENMNYEKRMVRDFERSKRKFDKPHSCFLHSQLLFWTFVLTEIDTYIKSKELTAVKNFAHIGHPPVPIENVIG